MCNFLFPIYIFSFQQEHRKQQDRSRREAELLSAELSPMTTCIKENHQRTSPGSEDVLLARHVYKGDKAILVSWISSFPRNS